MRLADGCTAGRFHGLLTIGYAMIDDDSPFDHPHLPTDLTIK